MHVISAYCILRGQAKGPARSVFVIQSEVCIKKFYINRSVSQKVVTYNKCYDCWLAIHFKNAYQGVLDLFAVYKPQPSQRSCQEQDQTKKRDIGDHHSFHAQIVDSRIAQSVE